MFQAKVSAVQCLNSNKLQIGRGDRYRQDGGLAIVVPMSFTENLRRDGRKGRSEESLQEIRGPSPKRQGRMFPVKESTCTNFPEARGSMVLPGNYRYFSMIQVSGQKTTDYKKLPIPC